MKASQNLIKETIPSDRGLFHNDLNLPSNIQQVGWMQAVA